MISTQHLIFYFALCVLYSRTQTHTRIHTQSQRQNKTRSPKTILPSPPLLFVSCIHKHTHTNTTHPPHPHTRPQKQNNEKMYKEICLLVGCLTSQQQAGVSQGRICSDNFTCCHAEIGVADPTFYLTQSQYTDTGPTSPSVDPITPGAWQGSHWSANF